VLFSLVRTLCPRRSGHRGGGGSGHWSDIGPSHKTSALVLRWSFSGLTGIFATLRPELAATLVEAQTWASSLARKCRRMTPQAELRHPFQGGPASVWSRSLKAENLKILSDAAQYWLGV
jgi:hypothetical protein